MYPRIEIDVKKLRHNATTLVNWMKERGLNQSFIVTKVLAGDKKVAKVLSETGFAYLADSRIQNLKAFKDIPASKVLLRLPMRHEIKDVITYSDMSLNSELDTILLLNEEACRQQKVHNIMLMFDVGDLREGIWFEDDYLPIISQILQLRHIKLKGIGINLTCYGGVIPSITNTNEIIKIKNHIESEFSVKIDMISGGNSSSIDLMLKNQLPNGINNLRLGESVVLGKETAYSQPINGLYQDVFTLKTKVIELKTKPSYPIGEIGVDSFGVVPIIEDLGLMKRAIVGIGKQDITLSNLVPINSKMKVIGGSSDHLIIDVTTCSVNLNDTISFHVNYPGLLQLMTSRYVKKYYKNL
jgi:ornithine racemase